MCLIHIKARFILMGFSCDSFCGSNMCWFSWATGTSHHRSALHLNGLSWEINRLMSLESCRYHESTFMLVATCFNSTKRVQYLVQCVSCLQSQFNKLCSCAQGPDCTLLLSNFWVCYIHHLLGDVEYTSDCILNGQKFKLYMRYKLYSKEISFYYFQLLKFLNWRCTQM